MEKSLDFYNASDPLMGKRMENIYDDQKKQKKRTKCFHYISA